VPLHHAVLLSILAALLSTARNRAALQLKTLALRHQIGVLRRSAPKRPKLTNADRLLWIWLSRVRLDWRSALSLVKAETVAEAGNFLVAI
jgi:hypothetical protein